MAFKDIMQKMQGVVDKVSVRREDGQKVPQNTMPNGSVSGYQPPVGRKKFGFFGNENKRVDEDDMAMAEDMQPLQPGTPPRPTAHAAEPRQPYGNQAGSQPMPPPTGRIGRWARKDYGTQRQPVQPQQGFGMGNQPPAQPQQGFGMGNQPPVQPQQGFGMGNQPPVQPQQGFGMGNQPPVQPQQGFGMGSQPPVQPQQTAYVPRHQSGTQGTWQGYPQQGGFQPQAQPVPPQQPPVQPTMQHSVPQNPTMQNPPMDNVINFPGTVIGDNGQVYAMVLRVAQITGIPSCYHLLEFMQSDEAIIVSAEQITDTVEADRCMDMLFGAASAMNQTFERISGKMIYLIAPRRVHVMPCDNVMHISRADRESRWPGFSRASAQPARRDDYHPGYGQRANAPQHTQYTDYGGFSNFGGRR